MAFVTSPSLFVRGTMCGLAENKLPSRDRPRTAAAARVSRSTRAVRMTGAGDETPTFKIANQASQGAWEKGYKEYLARSGERACLMAIDGYKKLGRGAVFVVDRPSANVGVTTPSGMQDGIASMYVSLAELERRDATVHEELVPIVSRMRLYDPAEQFVVVFEIQTETGGMQGVDIVKPKRMPGGAERSSV